MSRGYAVADIERIFTECAKLNFSAFDTHIIVGYPGETEEDVVQTTQFLVRHKVRYVLLSKFMSAPGMPAADGEPATDQEIADRIARMSIELRAAGIICNNELGGDMRSRFDVWSSGDRR